MRVLFAVLVGLAVMTSREEAASGQQAPRVDYNAKPISAVRYLKASNPGEDDRLGVGDLLVGTTLAISEDGNTLAVSTPYEDSGATGVNGRQNDESVFDSGAAYIFVRQGTSWRQQAYVKPSNTESSDKFGWALALSGDGNTLAVAATLEDSAARGINGDQRDNSAEESGAVYVFVRNGTSWTQQAYVKASNTDAGDQFGWSVALSRDGATMVVGSPSEGSAAASIDGNQADNAAADAGAAYVYVRRGTTWTPQSYLKASNAQGADRFGFCVALSADGNTVAVTGYDEDGSATGVNGVKNNDTPNSGAVYVFGRRGTAWSEETYLKASNTTNNAAFGSTLVISADGNTLAAGSGDEDGLSPGINGDQRYEPTNERSAGAVYVFGRSNGAWAQQAYVKAFNIGAWDLFGARMALSRDGNVLAVGAPGQKGGGRGINPDPKDVSAPESGAVYLFTREGSTWSQKTYLKAPNSDAYDHFGSGVAISGDGSVLALAADGDDGGSNGVGGNQGDNSLRDAGAVFVY